MTVTQFASEDNQPMNNGQVALVQSSFAMVEPAGDRLADLFYARLFQLDPPLRDLFGADLHEQNRKLMSMLGFLIGGLSDPDTFLPAARELGQRHATYGARPEHYVTVGAALLWTLEAALGDEFTPDVRSAWHTAYGLLSQAMQDGSRSAQDKDSGER
jgi:hemoglobin-like flavoprotein